MTGVVGYVDWHADHPSASWFLALGVWGAFFLLGLELFKLFFSFQKCFFGVLGLFFVEREMNPSFHCALAWLICEHRFPIHRASIDRLCCCRRDCETN